MSEKLFDSKFSCQEIRPAKLEKNAGETMQTFGEMSVVVSSSNQAPKNIKLVVEWSIWS